MKFGAIIQARLGSSRLPQKVLKKIKDKTVIELVIEQLRFSQKIEKIIIATTTKSEDSEISNIVKSSEVFYGNPFDVLDRYYQCAKFHSIENIVRITADCPLIDPGIVDKTIQLFEKGNFDYVSNFLDKENRFPDGTDVEVFSFRTLEDAWKNASIKYDKEHVTSYIYNNPEKFVLGTITSTKMVPSLHYSIDTIEDLDFVRELYQKLRKSPILFEDILEEVKRDPSLLEINNKSKHC